MPVPSAIEQYEAVLGSLGRLVDFDLSRLDRLGIPVTSCSLVVDGRLEHNGNGYGLTVEDARVSGLGELAESALSAARVAELRQRSVLGSRRELVRQQGADRVVDPRRLCLPAGSDYTDELPLEWVPMDRVPDGGEVWVPLEFVASESDELGSARALIQPISNGLGAGLDPERPLVHGLLEILQRHTNGLRFRALDAQSPVVEEAGLPASVAALVERFRRRGVEPVLKHAATELGVCSTYAVGLDDDLSVPIRLSGCGEAAHPSAEVSLTKALLEYANSRARKAFFFGSGAAARAIAPAGYFDAVLAGGHPGERRATEALTAWRDLAPEELRRLTTPDRSRSVGYPDITVEPAPELGTQTDTLAYLLDRLDGHEVLTTATRVGEVVVSKTVVTELEVENLSYGRLGELGVARMLAADLGLVRLGDGPMGDFTARVCLTPEAEDRLGGPAWYSYAAADRLVGPLYPLYREPPRHSVDTSPAS